MNTSIAKAFGAAAPRYHLHSGLQEATADWLLEGMQPAADVLDLGCGPGLVTNRLGSAGRVVGLDLSHSMLQQYSGASAVCADMQSLPLATDSFDLVLANLSMQWASQPGKAVCESLRVLRPGGCLLLTVPLPGSLLELEQSWRKVGDSYRHINAFVGLADWRVWADGAGAGEVVCEQREFVRWFGSPAEALRSLRGVGANRVTSGYRLGLTGRRRFAAMLSAYEELRQADGVPLTYQILRMSVRL